MEKKIVINNKDDLNKFYSRIKYYRLLFYRFTTFKSDNKEIEKIIEALNIKSRCKRIKFVYEEACRQIDEHNACLDNNICGFNNDKCRNKVKYGCCRKCYYLGNKGCTTSNLACKLFFCTKVCEKYKVLTFNDVKLLKCLSYRNQIIVKHNFFTKKEDYLVDLYIGWITIFILRYFYRTIKHKIVKKTKK